MEEFNRNPTPNGKRNPAASIIFSLLAEMARAERETSVERIKSGLDEANRKGKSIRGSGSEWRRQVRIRFNWTAGKLPIPVLESLLPGRQG